MKNFTISDFSHSFGVEENDFSSSCKKLIKTIDFSYREINGDELENLTLKVLKHIDNDNQIIGAKNRRDVWEKGWQENLIELRNSNYNEAKLIPKFIRPNNPIRLNKKYVIPNNPEFELDFVRIYRQWFLEYYFSGQSFDAIFCHQTIEHVHDLDRMFAKCATLLRKGGRCVISNDNNALNNKLLAQTRQM